MVQKNIQVISRSHASGTLILSSHIGSHVEFDFRTLRNWAQAGMVEWNGIFRLFRFSGILGQPREVHPKFRNEIPENVCSIRYKTRNFRNFWLNGKRPRGHWSGTHRGSEREGDPSTPGDVREWQSWGRNILRGTRRKALHKIGLGGAR